MYLYRLVSEEILHAMRFLYPTESLRLIQVSKVFLRVVDIKKDIQEITSCDCVQALVKKGIDLSPIYPQDTEETTILGKMVAYPKISENLVKFTIQWFEENAQQGHLGYQLALAISYEHGHGVAKNQNKALEWFIKVAEQKDVTTQFYLADKYRKEQNHKEAFKWFQMAADQDCVDAQYYLGLIYQAGDGVEKNDRQAFEWFNKAAHGEDVDAQSNLANMYYKGIGVPQDFAQAFKWYQKPAEEKFIEAQFILGVMFLEGKGTEKNYQKALFWFSKAAEQGCIDAQFNVALMYEKGMGVWQNDQKAFAWFSKAAEQGHPDAECCLQKISLLRE